MPHPYFEITSLEDKKAIPLKRASSFTLVKGETFAGHNPDLSKYAKRGKLGYVIDEDNRHSFEKGYEPVALACVMGYLDDVDFLVFISGAGAHSGIPQAQLMQGHLIYDYSGVYDSDAILKSYDFVENVDGEFRYTAAIPDELALIISNGQLRMIDDGFRTAAIRWQEEWLRATTIPNYDQDKDIRSLFHDPDDFSQYNTSFGIAYRSMDDVGCYIAVPAQRYLDENEKAILDRIIKEPPIIDTWAVGMASRIISNAAKAKSPFYVECEQVIDSVEDISKIWQEVLSESCVVYTTDESRAKDLYREVFTRKQTSVRDGAKPGIAILQILEDVLGLDYAYAARRQGTPISFL